jgi:hypothetical protein
MPFQYATPLVGVAIDGAYAYLALAHAALGDRPQAERCYQRAAPRLRARKSFDVLQRCEQALEHR